MPNLLHQFLHAANIQARTVLGELFNWHGQVGLTGFFTPTSGSLAFEVAGFMEEIDLLAVVDLDQFDAGNEPVLANREPLNYGRNLKQDESAYTLAFKMIGPNPTPAAGSGFSAGFSNGFF